MVWNRWELALVGWISGYVKLFCFVMLILLIIFPVFLLFIMCLLYFVIKSIELCLPQALAIVNITSTRLFPTKSNT